MFRERRLGERCEGMRKLDLKKYLFMIFSELQKQDLHRYKQLVQNCILCSVIIYLLCKLFLCLAMVRTEDGCQQSQAVEL